MFIDLNMCRTTSVKALILIIIPTSRGKQRHGESTLVGFDSSNTFNEQSLFLPCVLEHCINSIREFIMCKADFTPIVLIPPERSGIPVPLSEFRTTHVCRNFDKLLDWVQTERAADGDKETRLRHAKRIRELTGSKY
jgi:hypothetical protein